MKRIQGIYQDSRPQHQPQEKYRYAKNITILQDIGAIISEEGTKHIGQLPDMDIIGIQTITNDRIILFMTDGNQSEIGILYNGEYETIINNDQLLFDTRYPIETTYKSINDS